MLVWYSNNTFQVKDTSIQRTNAIVPSRPLDGESTVSVRHYCAVLVRLDVFFIGALAFGSFRMSSIPDMGAALDDMSMLEVLYCFEELVS